MTIDKITRDNDLIPFLLDQHKQTGNPKFMSAAHSIERYQRSDGLLHWQLSQYEWTNVEDELPKVAVNVLITDGKSVSMGYVLNMGDSGLCPWVAKQPVFHRDVTHWMPLPALPKN